MKRIILSILTIANPQARPDIKTIDFDLKNYECIFLGYPVGADADYYVTGFSIA